MVNGVEREQKHQTAWRSGKRLCRGIESPKVSFAMDSAQEEAGFEPSVPLYILTVSDPLLVGPVTVPFAKRKSPVGDRVPSVRRLLPPPSVPGHRLGALRWRVTGWRDLHPSAYGHAAGEVVRARAITAMVLRSRLQNPVEGRLRRAPDALEAARPDYLANPCLAG